MSEVKIYTFEIDLIYEPAFETISISYDYDTNEPEEIMKGNMPEGFMKDILDNISIVPTSYE